MLTELFRQKLFSAHKELIRLGLDKQTVNAIILKSMIPAVLFVLWHLLGLHQYIPNYAALATWVKDINPIYYQDAMITYLFWSSKTPHFLKRH